MDTSMDAVERVAVALWREDAERIGGLSIASSRTPEAFEEAGDDLREKWMRLARAAIGAMSGSDRVCRTDD